MALWNNIKEKEYTTMKTKLILIVTAFLLFFSSNIQAQGAAEMWAYIQGIINGDVIMTGDRTFGVDGTGVDVTFYSGTAGDYFLWDASEEALVIVGINAQDALDVNDGNVDINDDIDVDGTSNFDNTDIDGTFTMDGTAFDVNSTTTVTIDNTNTTNGVVINAVTSTSPISIGHTTSETTVNDNLSVTGDLAVDGTANLDNTDIDGTLTMDGTALDINSTTTVTIDNTNTSNGVVINAVTSASPVSIGHTTSETTVNDNLVVTGDADLNGALDVDGTANLDVTDIDGSVDIQGAVTVNESGADLDFRVETDSEDSALVVDGGSGLVHIEGSLVVDGGINYGVDTSATTDDYKVVIATLGNEGIANGTIIWVDVKNGTGTPADNGGACDLFVNGNAAINIKTQNGGDPAADWIDTESVFGVIYSGSVFLLLTPDANP